MSIFLIVILSAIVIVGVSVLLLGVMVFFVKGKRFPMGHDAHHAAHAAANKRNIR